jgi:signal transduction histidine kinase
MNSSDSGPPHFRVSPAVLGPLGAEQLQDPALAVLELVKNSWDADARRVKIAVDQARSPGRILVNDDGHGMSVQEFKDHWLVIGNSNKRAREASEAGRPLIGEKGLGRLASFALGKAIAITSARANGQGFVASVDWEQLTSEASLEDYHVPISSVKTRKGTKVAIQDLKAEWSQSHTDFLVSHAEFLASVPGQRFHISLRVNGKPHVVENALETVDRLAEASLEMVVAADGRPILESCVVNDTDVSSIVTRDMSVDEQDRSLAGARLTLKFFRRDEAARRLRLGPVLQRNEVTHVLERYQGIRIYRDGINVPPYGLNGDDWAGLEKQRTATGGPTMVPGNSQLVGELRVSKRKQPQLVITAGRSGFADQSAVASLANYVRWAVRSLGTARRAEHLKLTAPGAKIPGRVDEMRSSASKSGATGAREALATLANVPTVRANPELRRQLTRASKAVGDAFARNEETLRLYAQLASTGIAATSFSHEMRAEFDVVSEAIDELKSTRRRPDQELIELLNASWGRIRSFAGLFKVLPVKMRRHRKLVSAAEVRSAAHTILGLAPPEKIKVELLVPSMKLNVVPAELDSILLNLLSNSVKAVAESENRDTGRITVKYEVSGADLAIRVADNGCGVSSKVRRIMFEPLEGRFAEGTGMGLPISKYLAERYQGDVSISEAPPPGFVTEFVATLHNVVQ